MIKEKDKPWVLKLLSVNNDGTFRENTYGATNAWEFLTVDTLDGGEEYYSTQAGDLNFSYDVARLLFTTRGSKAHLYALERKINAKTPAEIKLWGLVLNELDDMNGEANGKT